MNSPFKKRELYIDSARGISIVLVVLWHSFGEDMFYNGPLVFLRMPLFFFMAGIFSVSVLKIDIHSVIKDKIGQLLWIFVVWSSILYLTRSAVKQMRDTGHIDLYPLYSIFWNPPPTMWFVYALAIAYFVAAITAKLPTVAVLVTALGLYVWSATFGEWANPPFDIKILRLLPVFLIAVRCSASILKYVRLYAWTWPIHALVFIPSAYFVYYSDLALNGVVTFTVSFFGIAGILTFCAFFSESRFVRLTAWLGQRSIYIYVMHRIVLTYVGEAAAKVGIDHWPGVAFAVFALAVLLPPSIGMWIVDRFMPWLVRAPWLMRGGKRLSGATS